MMPVPYSAASDALDEYKQSREEREALEANNERLSAALKSQTERAWQESERADKADHMRVAIETGKVHPALAIDVNEHRQQAYQTGWNDGYAEGFEKASSTAEKLSFDYKIREALGFGPLHPLSNLDTDARQMRVAMIACATLARAAIAAAGQDRLGYIGGADTESQESITVTFETTLGDLREARRALWAANVS